MEDIFRMKLSFGRSLRMEVDSTGLHRLNVKLNFEIFTSNEINMHRHTLNEIKL